MGGTAARPEPRPRGGRPREGARTVVRGRCEGRRADHAGRVHEPAARAQSPDALHRRHALGGRPRRGDRPAPLARPRDWRRDDRVHRGRLALPLPRLRERALRGRRRALGGARRAAARGGGRGRARRAAGRRHRGLGRGARIGRRGSADAADDRVPHRLRTRGERRAHGRPLRGLRGDARRRRARRDRRYRAPSRGGRRQGRGDPGRRPRDARLHSRPRGRDRLPRLHRSDHPPRRSALHREGPRARRSSARSTNSSRATSRRSHR